MKNKNLLKLLTLLRTFNDQPFLVCLPEVIRTRLREEGSKYKYFFQTARLVAVEEGYAAFYRGLVPQLIRQIPNTAIVLSTYELIVHLLGEPSKWSCTQAHKNYFWPAANVTRIESIMDRDVLFNYPKTLNDFFYF